MTNNLKYSECCRVCLLKTGLLKNVFNQHFDSIKYSQIICDITGIEIFKDKQELPIQICGNCEVLLINSYEFKKTFIDSNEKLINFLNQLEDEINIKVEEIDFDEEFNQNFDSNFEDEKTENKIDETEAQQEVVPKKQNPIRQTPNIDFTELESSLDTVEGRRIIEYYNEHQILNEANRQELVLIIIRREANKPGNEQSLQISSARFQQMTKEIISKFPNEMGHVYYKPYSKESGLAANGKLFAKYENYKKKYLLRKTKKSGTISQNQCLDSDEDIVFLKNNILPWERIEKLWKKTFDLRNIEISQSKPTLNEYLKKFPCLRTTNGYQLLEKDFDMKYPDKTGISKENWDEALVKIYEYITEHKKTDPAVEELLKDYAINPNLVTLLILPIIFKVSYGRKRNGDRTLIKYTKKEICDFFMILVPVSIQYTNLYFGKLLTYDISHSQTKEEYQLKVAELKKSCAEKKNTFEPVIIIVGTVDKIVSSSIIIDNVTYIVADYLRAVDIAFKSFQALNCCYPTVCQTVWSFIQKYIYKINTPYDKNYSAVNKVIDQLK